MIESVDKVKLYIKATGKLTFNRKHLVNLLDVNDRQVREAFYSYKDLGYIVIAYPKDCLTIVTSHNYNVFREQAIAQVKRDKGISLKKLKRINRQLKGIPERDQLMIDKELLLND